MWREEKKLSVVKPAWQRKILCPFAHILTGGRVNSVARGHGVKGSRGHGFTGVTRSPQPGSVGCETCERLTSFSHMCERESGSES